MRKFLNLARIIRKWIQNVFLVSVTASLLFVSLYHSDLLLYLRIICIHLQDIHKAPVWKCNLYLRRVHMSSLTFLSSSFRSPEFLHTGGKTLFIELQVMNSSFSVAISVAFSFGFWWCVMPELTFYWPCCRFLYRSMPVKQLFCKLPWTIHKGSSFCFFPVFNFGSHLSLEH